MIKEILRVEIPHFDYTSNSLEEYWLHIDRSKEPLFQRVAEMGFVPYGPHREFLGRGGVRFLWSQPEHELDELPLHFLAMDSGLWSYEAVLEEHQIGMPITNAQQLVEATRSLYVFYLATAPYVGYSREEGERMPFYEFLDKLAGQQSGPTERATRALDPTPQDYGGPLLNKV